jgi:hypothetical protein
VAGLPPLHRSLASPSGIRPDCPAEWRDLLHSAALTESWGKGPNRFEMSKLYHTSFLKGNHEQDT